MKEIKVRITTTEMMLGTSPSDEKLYDTYVASNAPDALSMQEEIEAHGVDATAEKGKTVFARDEEGNPILWDYQIKGFFKDSCSALKKVSDSKSAKLKAYKKEIDGLIFPEPRKIPIVFDGEIGDCQRPLRASTPQGERVAIAHSESIPAGAVLEFSILILKDDLEDVVIEWLDYGKLRGLGQWRNSGCGRFNYEIIE